MRKKIGLLTAILLAIAGILLAGCGGGTVVSTTIRTVPAVNTPAQTRLPTRELAQACPTGQSQIGCAVLPTPSSSPSHALVSAPKFPDVSVFQGFVNWPAVKSWQLAHGWPAGGIFKLGEGFGRDSQSANNATALHSLKMWKAAYWFVRNVGCTGESNAIIAAARALGIRVIVLDLEVPEARGYGLCLTPPLRRAGLAVVEYTAPGTNPGGVDTSDPLWEATYGSSFTAIWHPVVAWQCTDGHFGCVTFVPGIGTDDVSFDFGISKLAGPPPPPPDPFRILDKTVRHFGAISASEYTAAKAWKLHGCLNPVRRATCRRTHSALEQLAGRLWFIAHNRRDARGNWHPLAHADWTHKGQPFQILWHDLHQTK